MALVCSLNDLKTEPQCQICIHIKEACIYVQHINYEENEPSTEEKKPQMWEKGTVEKEKAVVAILFFEMSQKYSQATSSDSKHTLQI